MFRVYDFRVFDFGFEGVGGIRDSMLYDSRRWHFALGFFLR